MGSSKKKKEKKKDFIKQKLKVGKNEKAANYTDTSFKAKSISLPNQNLGTKDITSYIALTKHHSSSTRKEVLGHIEKQLDTFNDATILKKVISNIIPLINDESLEVRKALLSLFEKLCNEYLSVMVLHDKQFILFIHSSMNHLNPSIKNFLINFLNLVINHFPDNLINLHFTKTLDGLLAFKTTDKTKALHTKIFKNFIEKSLVEPTQLKLKYHVLTNNYITINEFNSLNLFHNENLSTDLNTRKQILTDKHEDIKEKIDFVIAV